MKKIKSKIKILVFAVWAGLLSLPCLSEEAAPEYKATTTKNIKIPLAEIKIVVVPLTQKELVVEADAWQDLLKDKVKEISLAEIAVLQQNLQIKKAQTAAKAIKNAQEAAADAIEAKGETQEKAENAVKKAQQKIEEAQKATAEAQAAQTTAEENSELKAATDKAIQSAKEAGKTNTVTETKTTDQASSLNLQTSTNDVSNTETTTQLAQVAEAAKNVANSENEIKTTLLDNLTQLRTERTAIIDRFQIVIDALEAKGGEIKAYEQYRDAVSGIKLNVSDTSATIKALQGWISSTEGGIRWGINIIQFILTIIAFLIISSVVSKLIKKGITRSQGMSNLLKTFLVTMVRRLILGVGFVFALAALEIKVAPILAILGGAAFVIAFALQDTLSNFASGILILMYRPFDVGDSARSLTKA